MTVHTIIIPVVQAQRRLAHRVHESSTVFPGLRRKPRIILKWLIGARRAQLALLASVLLLQLAFPPIRDAVLEGLFSKENVAEKFVGIFGGESKSDKRRATGRRVVTAIAWMGSTGLVALLLWLHIPAAVVRAAAIARVQERKGDGIVRIRPSESVELYRSALSMVCDPDHVAALKSKIRAIDDRISMVVSRGAPTATVVPTPETDALPSTSAGQSALIAGRYRVLDELGRGATGRVHRADDVVLGRQVALKELAVRRADDDTMFRFRQEARIVAQLNHPNIVQVYDLAEHDGNVWIAMELIEGGDLASDLKRKRRLAVQETTRLACSMAEALAFAHDRGIVHRDLKPLNVLLDERRTPKITDFGLAKLTQGSAHTIEGTILGSPHYMSPEQADGGLADHRSDIYAFGVMLYHMLAGRLPFEGEIASVLMQHIRRPPPRLRTAVPNLNIPPALERLIMQMLAKAPDKRPRNMMTIAQRLRPHVVVRKSLQT